MRLKDSAFYKLVLEEHKFNFGTLYFFDSIIVSEINEGVLFDYQMAEEINEQKNKFYTLSNQDLDFISNRVNNYALIPQDWMKYTEKYNCFKSYVVVPYSKTAASNIDVEKFFYKKPIISLDNLVEAFDFVSLPVPEKN